MPRPRPSRIIVDSSPESQEPFIVESPGDLSHISSGLTSMSIDQRLGSLDEDASSRVNDHADARFGAKMRRYGSAPAFAGLFPQPQRHGGQTFLAPKRNELERIKEYFRTITDAALDSLPEIYNILQSIGQAHPFVAGASVVFETVMRLVQYKRRNDAMADALIVDMVETIKSLTVLKYLPPPDAGEVVSRTKVGRVVELVNAIHEAIKACGNACDTYYKLKGLGCFLQSSKWLEEFDAYRNRLTSLREHLHLALTIHFGLELTTRGDPQLQENTRLLKDLCEKVDAFPSTRRQTSIESGVLPPHIIAMAEFARTGARAEGSGSAIEYDDSDPSSHIEQNHCSFEGRYTLLRRYTEDEGLTKTLLRFEVAGDSSHMIQDKDIREVWREMGWKGNVKARHFVFALRDHFRDKIAQPKWPRVLSESSLDSAQSSPTDRVDRDEWALEYLNVSHLQPIMEAFDDDASGFVTLTEVENMYTCLPSGWSLLKWLAYWAAGWQTAMSSYASRIDDILSEMFNLKSQVLLCNRTCIEEYLAGVWSPITELTSSFRRRDDELLSEKFGDYTDEELSRLKNNLECIQYRVDLDNLEGVTGGGRIEKSAFPLLYLLLERDCNIMKLCLTDIIHMSELYDSRKAICSVVAAIDVRCEDLIDLFRQQKLDPEQQLKIFACQLFDNRHHRGSFWSIDNLRFRTFGEQLNRQHEVEAPPKERPVVTLNYPTSNADYWFHYPFNEPGLVMNADGASDNAEGLEELLGRWSGFITRTDGQSYSHAMVMLDIQLSDDHQSVHASGESARGIPWTFSGKVRECIHEYPSDIDYPYSFRITYGSHHPPQMLHGQLNDEESTLSGVWGFPGKDEKSFRFYFKKTDPSIMRFRPSPADFARNRSQALWRFAIDATVGAIRQTVFSSEYLRERQAIRRRYIALLSQIESGVKLTPEERDDMSECFRRMTPSEARFSSMVYDMQRRSKVIHYGVECMNCKVHNTQFVGARLVCLTCTAAGHVVDLCEKPQCASATISPGLDHHSHAHHPQHDMLKLRRSMHVHREFGRVFRDAQTALAHGRNILSDVAPQQGHISPTDKLFQAVISPAPFAMGGRSSRVAVMESACVKCEMVISQPCWYCVDCKGEVFVCTSCDHKYGGVQVDGSEHRAGHSLVMCQRPASREVHVRSGSSEQALGTDRRIKALEKKLESLERKVDRLSGLLLDRFDRLEGMMRAPVVSRSGPALS